MNGKLNEFIEAVQNGTEFDWIGNNGFSSFSESTQKVIVQAYISAAHNAEYSSWDELKKAILDSIGTCEHIEQNGIEIEPWCEAL